MLVLATMLRQLVEMTRKVVRGLFLHHAFDHAATMAFYFFLGTIPLLIVGGVLVGHVAGPEEMDLLIVPIYRMLPGVTADLIRAELRHIADAEVSSVAPLSILGFLWLTSNGFHNLMDVFEMLIGARPRSWLRQRTIAVVWVLGILVASCVSVWFLVLTTGGSEAIARAARRPDVVRELGDLFLERWRSGGVMVVFGAVTAVGLALFYRLAVLHPRGVRRRVLWGTFVAMTLWALVSWAFGAYVGSIAHYSVYYGSLATVAVTLLWFYLTSLAFIIGAEVNAQLEGLRDVTQAAVERS